MKYLFPLLSIPLVAIALVISVVGDGESASPQPEMVNLDDRYMPIEKASKAFDVLLKIQMDLVQRVEVLEKKLKIKPSDKSFRVKTEPNANTTQR